MLRLRNSRISLNKRLHNYGRALALLTFMVNGHVKAEDVVLNPGTISGNVGIDGYTIETATLEATGEFGTARQQVQIGAAQGSYNLTVNVPENTGTSYQVWASTTVDDGNNLFGVEFKRQQAAVSEAIPGTQDFLVSTPGFVEGTISLSGDPLATISRVSLIIASSDAVTSKISVSQNADSGSFNYRVPVAAGAYGCLGNITLDDNTRQSLPTQLFSVASGETVRCDSVIAVIARGSIAGTINFSGTQTVDQFALSARVSGDTQGRIFAANNNEVAYQLDDVLPGNATVRGRVFANSGDDELTLPQQTTGGSSSVVVTANQTANLDFDLCQSHIDGELILSGSMSNEDITLARMRAWSESGGGQSNDTVADQQFDLLATEGRWWVSPSTIGINRTDAGKPDINMVLNQISFAESYQQLNCNDTIVLPAYELETGFVTVNFQVTTGDLLDSPILSGDCEYRDASGDIVYEYIFRGSSSVRNSETGSVRVGLPQGFCRLSSTATVNGTRTSFGEIDVDVKPGSDTIVDTGAPSLTITSPTQECIADASVLVQGQVTDTSGISYVRINQLDAILTPVDGDAFAFSQTIDLQGGVNEIRIEVADTEGNTTSESVIVNVDSAPPSVVWIEDMTETTEHSILIEGIVSDDNDVDALTINGELVSLTPTATPGEYTFAYSLTLVEGINTVTLQAMDTTGCEDTVQVRTVIRSSDIAPPIADAGLDQLVRAGDVAQLDGRGSFDDSTPTSSLTYQWAFSSFPGNNEPLLNGRDTVSPTFEVLEAGHYELQLVVTDEAGNASVPDTVVISSLNEAPTAIAGPDRVVQLATIVQLDGSESFDPENDPLTYQWVITSAPAGSTAELSNSVLVTPLFTPNVEGEYVATLIVSDAIGTSNPDSLSIEVVTDITSYYLSEAFAEIVAIDPADFDSSGHQNSLGNFVDQALSAYLSGRTDQVVKKIEDAIERVDGCTLRGSPDVGNNPKKDYVTVCGSQFNAYELLTLALNSI